MKDIAERGLAVRRTWRVAAVLLASLAPPLVAGAQSASVHPDRGIDCAACHPCGGAATVNAPSCSSCHDGDGTVLSGRTPPFTMGWPDPTTVGDAHGAAGQVAPLDCGECHEGHKSANAFVLRSDGTGTISREGVGGERLCGRCHATRHASCATECHTWHASDPIANGAPCFHCHGHDFTRRRFLADGTDEPWTCSHCHGKGFRPSTQPPPTISNVRVATGYDRARVEWRTPTSTRGAVEWGAPDLTRMTANRWYGNDQAVMLSGLVEGTAYAFRARATDERRQGARSATATFTAGVASVPRPIQQNGEYTSETSPIVVSFGWYEDTEPPGLPVTFEWQLANTPTFQPVVAAGQTTSPAVTMPLPLDFPWYYRARARFTNRSTWSTWSASGSFTTRSCYNCH